MHLLKKIKKVITLSLFVAAKVLKTNWRRIRDNYEHCRPQRETRSISKKRASCTSMHAQELTFLDPILEMPSTQRSLKALTGYAEEMDNPNPEKPKEEVAQPRQERLRKRPSTQQPAAQSSPYRSGNTLPKPDEEDEEDKDIFPILRNVAEINQSNLSPNAHFLLGLLPLVDEVPSKDQVSMKILMLKTIGHYLPSSSYYASIQRQATINQTTVPRYTLPPSSAPYPHPWTSTQGQRPSTQPMRPTTTANYSSSYSYLPKAYQPSAPLPPHAAPSTNTSGNYAQVPREGYASLQYAYNWM
ncbi:uncharacterized protein LOC120939565 [Rana temporaria]|uniref:uncharacterized protein LOC120939565 n=1 Tax=Rana temporaria TaxID=8407 RepID=UPI001AAC8847|nr:uncharacterized protein LOC120939565 [Rana temporaria]